MILLATFSRKLVFWGGDAILVSCDMLSRKIVCFYINKKNVSVSVLFVKTTSTILCNAVII
jgi:hypothetical protein